MSLHITIDCDRLDDLCSRTITDLINMGYPVTFAFDLDEVPVAEPTRTFDDIVNDTLKRAAKYRPFSELVDASPELKKAMAERPEYFQSDEWKARFAVECPTCWSGRGAACVRPTGESYGNKYVHKARLDAYANLI